MSDDSSNEIPPHCSPLRSMWAEGHGDSYQAFQSLDEARKHQHTVVVMDGDYGGQIYLTCPVEVVKCDQKALEQLLEDLNGLSWGDGESLHYEVVPPRAKVAGGMGGGEVLDHVWIHREFEAGGLLPEVKQIIDGNKLRLSKEAIERAKGRSQW